VLVPSSADTNLNSFPGFSSRIVDDDNADWDSSDEVGSLFTFTGTPSSPTEEITVNAAGVYHIAYGIDSEHTINEDERFAQKTRIQVDSGSGYVDANACYANSFARGFAPEQSPLLRATATIDATTETMIFDYTDYTPNNSNYTGLYDDQDISDKDLKKYVRLLDSIQTIETKINDTSDKITYYANLDTAKAHTKLDKLNERLDKLEDKLDDKLDKLPDDTVPLASLQLVGEMLHEDKPLKVLLLNNTDDNIELTYSTPSAYTIEQDNSTNGKFDKKVTVTHESALHYSNVTAFTDIPEYLVVGNTDFRLF